MFTGLVEEKGKIVRAQPSANGLRLTVEARVVTDGTVIGDSIAVNGTCLTAVSVSGSMLEFDAVRETVERSTLGDLKPGQPVNLERALRAGARMGGHMVLGHVDGIGVIREIRKAGGETVFRFEASPEVMRFVVEKGSIAVDGISLTIADYGRDWFSVAVIPHTLGATTLGDRSVGGRVNLETDIIGKYVLKFVGKSDSDDRLMSLLDKGGFLDTQIPWDA